MATWLAEWFRTDPGVIRLSPGPAEADPNLKGEVMADSIPPVGLLDRAGDSFGIDQTPIQPEAISFSDFRASGEPSAPAFWTPAVFRDRARELHRRLSVWHVRDVCQPAWFPERLAFENAIRWTFKEHVIRGDHRPLTTRISIIPQVSETDSASGHSGTILVDHPSDFDKPHTIWLLRDFYEHLSDAGNTPEAEFLRLKLERILEQIMYIGRPLDDLEKLDDALVSGVNEYRQFPVGERRIDPSRLEELVEASDRLSNQATLAAIAFPSHAQATPSKVPTNALSPKLKQKQKRGAKPKYDPKNDKRIADAWSTGRYRTYLELAEALGLKRRDVELALDRVRKA